MDEPASSGPDRHQLGRTRFNDSTHEPGPGLAHRGRASVLEVWLAISVHITDLETTKPDSVIHLKMHCHYSSLSRSWPYLDLAVSVGF